MGTQVERMRELVPFFVEGEGDNDVVNEALVVRGKSGGGLSRENEGVGVRKTVEIQVREWDHSEGWFSNRTVLVEDTVTRPASVGADAGEATPSSRNGQKASKQQQKRSAKKKPTGASGGAQVRSLTPPGSAERYAGYSFETRSPEPHSLPKPTHLLNDGDSIRRQLPLV